MVLEKHGGAHPLEVVETVLEVADVAWAALERRHDSRLCATAQEERLFADGELERQRAENRRLREIIEENTNVFEALQRSLSLSKDCPDDVSPTPFLFPFLIDFFFVFVSFLVA